MVGLTLLFPLIFCLGCIPKISITLILVNMAPMNKVHKIASALQVCFLKFIPRSHINCDTDVATF